MESSSEGVARVGDGGVVEDPAHTEASTPEAVVPGAVVQEAVAPEAVATAVAATAPASLSPSRAGDFMQCPLLYRFRVIDRLPEKPSPAATKGTLVHAVLERLFDAPHGPSGPRRGPSH